LVQRIEGAVLTVAAEVVVQRLCRLAEVSSIAQVVGRVAEVRVIQDVEEIASGLKRNSFREAELAAQRDVALRGADSRSETGATQAGHRIVVRYRVPSPATRLQDRPADLPYTAVVSGAEPPTPATLDLSSNLEANFESELQLSRTTHCIRNLACSRVRNFVTVLIDAGVEELSR